MNFEEIEIDLSNKVVAQLRFLEKKCFFKLFYTL